MVLYDKEQPHEPRIFLRGNPNRLGESVPRQFPDVLNDYRQPFANGSGRLELAQAIVDPRNPLTARVIVNRVWMHHFGRGLVTTPSDFGLRSDPPSHPTLLDWLATAFIEDGWSIKRLHRLIMLSAAYQQANDNRAECKSVDQENRLLWRMNRRRLSFEALRDSLLAVSGDLDNKIGGPPIEMFGEQFVARRSVYGYIDRMDVPHLLTTFDFPEPVATSPQRDSTTVAPQALFFMNHTFTREAAERLLRRDDVHSLENDAKLQRIYSLLFSRMPREFEMQLARDYLGAEPTGEQWVQFTHALLMTNEIAFVD